MAHGRQQAVQLEDASAQPHIIKRPRLTKLLDEAGARIVLLVAPAGYGKTTLAREWTSQRGRRGLWYRARSGASDVAVVARSLSVALAPLSATIERSTRELLAALRTPEDEPDAIADLLVEELDGWPSGTWLVIDEYELVAPHEAPVKLIERFVQVSGAHVVITSRDRPGWIAPRDLLYGDAFELRGSALSMTLEEASKVLESGTQPPGELIELADGWPAVIGLAALLPGELKPTSDVQSTLFDFVAQELFDGLDRDVQRHLVLLAIPSTLNHRLVQAVAEDDAERVVRDSVQAGFMTTREGQDLEIHPLCRAFLARKLSETGQSTDQMDTFAGFLIDTSKWDDAFDLIRQFDLPERMPHLVDRGLRRVLTEGRLAAVEKWVAWAEQREYETPELALVRAEIYLRRGQWQLSESLAMSCAESLGSSELVAQAHLCAGAAAHLLDHVECAWENYGRALKSDASAEIRRRALWGRFVASYWTKHPDYRRALSDLEETKDSSPAHLLRLEQAKLVVALREGNLSTAVAGALTVEPLLPHIEDPLVRNSFLSQLTYALGIGARYSEAEAFAQRQVEEATRFHLNFALPTALVNLAVSRLGLGAYTAAAALVERSELEDETGDSFIRVERDIVRACIALSRGEAQMAVSLLSEASLDDARSDIVGEALATRALAEACSGDSHAAKLTIELGAGLASEVRSQVLLACATAILALNAGGSTSLQRLEALANTVMRTGSFDSVVCAMRACPTLVEASMHHPAMVELLGVAASRSGDAVLAAATGKRANVNRTRRLLSNREREVLQLVAEGFRNQEIGRRLFISPMTVKTHLQNIYEKLDVSSRTEAAIKAKEAGLLR